MDKQWCLYILCCKDGTLYTGITDNLQRRLSQHNEGKGAKYTRGRGPVSVVYVEQCENKSHALRREIAVKKLSRAQKQLLCESYNKSASGFT